MPNYIGNPYFQGNYNPYFQQSAYQQPVTQTPVQNSSFIHVQNESQAREWRVAPGNSVIFLDDNLPYCYTKSAGLSELEPPIFKKFRLEEENINTPQQLQQSIEKKSNIDLSEYMLKSDFEIFKTEFETLKTDFENLKKELV